MTTKSDLIEAVASSTGSTKSTTKEIVDATINHIASSLLQGDKIQIAGLGTFAVKDTAARAARNPRTGETVNLPAGRKITFKPAADLKAKL